MIDNNKKVRVRSRDNGRVCYSIPEMNNLHREFSKNEVKEISYGELKQLMDQTFLLQYLAMKTLDEDKLETQDTKDEISNAILEQMLDKMIDMNTELTGQELKQMIAERYEVVRYKKMEILQEIQKIFKKNIDKYTKKVEKKF